MARRPFFFRRGPSLTAKLEERLSDAQKAKQAMLEKYKSRAAPDPAKVAEDIARAKARDERRELAELMRKERLAAEIVAKEEAKRREAEEAIQRQLAEEAAADLARTERRAAEKALKAAQKEARDQRYAARKERTGRRR